MAVAVVRHWTMTDAWHQWPLIVPRLHRYAHENAESGKASAAAGVKIDVD
jgi:hypothetical protein